MEAGAGQSGPGDVRPVHPAAFRVGGVEPLPEELAEPAGAGRAAVRQPPRERRFQLWLGDRAAAVLPLDLLQRAREVAVTEDLPQRDVGRGCRAGTGCWPRRRPGPRRCAGWCTRRCRCPGTAASRAAPACAPPPRSAAGPARPWPSRPWPRPRPSCCPVLMRRPPPRRQLRAPVHPSLPSSSSHLHPPVPHSRADCALGLHTGGRLVGGVGDEAAVVRVGVQRLADGRERALRAVGPVAHLAARADRDQ